MNKLNILLLLVAIGASAVLARTSPQVRRPFKFVPGQTYIYEYRGRQWNGLVNLADQYAGLNIDCDVILQTQNDVDSKDIVMKLDDIKVDQLHTQTINTNEVRSLIPGEETNVQQNTLFKEQLSKPIRFTYLDGKVVRFYAEQGDAEWSINIKKSILSLFQLDLAPSKIIKSPSQILKERATGYNSEDAILEATDMPLVYPIYEESFGGICETQYVIDSIENVQNNRLREQITVDDLTNDVLNVTKTVNYKNCLTDPSVSHDRHSNHVKSQTLKGKLFSEQPSVFNNNYMGVPEELKQKYSAQYESIEQVSPVEQYSYTKYNLTTAPASLVARRQVPVSSPSEMLLIESIFSEGKIKYQADGDQLVSDTQQSLKLISVTPTSDLARVQQQQLVNLQVREPVVPYETIQCELNSQKLKFYQAVWKYVQARQQIQGQQQQQQNAPLYSHQTVLPFALSASWYPIVATEGLTNEQSLIESLNPEQLAKSFELNIESLADDVISQDIVDSKRAGEKVVRMINVLAFMPKYKLVQIHENIIAHIKQAKLEQIQSARKVGKQQEQIDNWEVSKWKVVRKLFLDTLPLAGSKQAVEIIEGLIKSEQVKPWEAKELCETVPANLNYPDTEIIDAFVRLSQLPQVRKNRATFASCNIAVGKMIGSAYAKSKDATYRPTTGRTERLPAQLRSDDDLVKQVVVEADPRRQLPLDWQNQPENEQLYQRLVLDEQDLAKYVKIYKQLLNKAGPFNEKVIYIETLAHMKVPHVLPILEPYVSGRLSLAQCLGQQPLDIVPGRQGQEQQWYRYKQESGAQVDDQDNKDWSPEQSKGAEECNYMRTIAIYALAHVTRTNPEKIQAMLLPVFDNTYEPYQIRIAAFTSIMVSPISESILERIASQMWREPSKEVASFVVGAIDTFSKFMSPQLSSFKYAAQKASESMPKQYLDTWKFSSIAGGDHFNHLKQSGAAWLAEIIHSNVSTVPRGAYVHYGNFHGVSGSKYDNVFELGFTSKGIESLFKQYIAWNNEQQSDEINVVATILENLYDAKDDLLKFYHEARDEIKSDAVNEWVQERIAKKGQQQEEWEKDASIFIKRQQPIEGVNSELGKKERKFSQVFDGVRNKRSVRIEAHGSQDDDEEAKMTIFSKIFEQTSYHALDKTDLIQLIEKADDYVKMVANKLVLGGNLHYVKLMMKSNNWHMIPSQLGLPIVVTHRSPIILSLKIDASANGQQTSTRTSQIVRQQVTGQNIPNVLGQNFATAEALNITALVQPKVMSSNIHFLFAVEQASSQAYGVQTEKSYQVSLPVELSIAYSQPKQLCSLAIQPKTPNHSVWFKQIAKTFVGPVSLTAARSDNWLGQDHVIRVPSSERFSKQAVRANMVVPSLVSGIESLINKPKESHLQAIQDLETPYKFQKSYTPQWLGLEIELNGATDDKDGLTCIERPEIHDEYIEQWTSVENVEQPDQHTKSGPLGELLHIVDSISNSPSKYSEFYSTLKTNQDQSKVTPVFRFDFLLNGKTNKEQINSQRINQVMGRGSPVARLDIQKIQREIERVKSIQLQQQQQPIALEVY